MREHIRTQRLQGDPSRTSSEFPVTPKTPRAYVGSPDTLTSPPQPLLLWPSSTTVATVRFSPKTTTTNKRKCSSPVTVFYQYLSPQSDGPKIRRETVERVQ